MPEWDEELRRRKRFKNADLRAMCEQGGLQTSGHRTKDSYIKKLLSLGDERLAEVVSAFERGRRQSTEAVKNSASPETLQPAIGFWGKFRSTKTGILWFAFLSLFTGVSTLIGLYSDLGGVYRPTPPKMQVANVVWQVYVPPSEFGHVKQIPMLEVITDATPNLEGMRDYVFGVKKPISDQQFEEIKIARSASEDPFPDELIMLYSDCTKGLPQEIRFSDSACKFLQDCYVVCFLCGAGTSERMNTGQGTVVLSLSDSSNALLSDPKGVSLFVFAYPIDEVQTSEYSSPFIIPTVVLVDTD